VPGSSDRKKTQLRSQDYVKGGQLRISIERQALA
jgi:hypothetical protein